MRFFLFCIFIVSTHAMWKPKLKGQFRLKAIDKSKMLDVKIKGHGYFQYLMPQDDLINAAGVCSGSESGLTNYKLDPSSSTNTLLSPSTTPTLCSIRDVNAKGGPAKYVASTGVTLGTSLSASSYYEAGFQWSATAIQVNAERSSLITASTSSDPLSTSVEYYNGDRSVDATDLNLNWIDPNVYSLKIDTASGAMNVYTYGSGTCGNVLPGYCGYTYSPYTATVCTYDSDCTSYMSESGVQWTITGYGHTVMRGTVEETTVSGSTSTRLVVKNGELRSASLGIVSTTEIVAYTFAGVASSIGAGSVLGVELLTTTPCNDYYVTGSTNSERATECAAKANALASSGLTKHLVYQIRNPEVTSPLNRYTCEVLASTTPHTYTTETNAILYNCHNALGYHIDNFEKNSGDPLLAARLVYNRYGRFHINKYGYLVDPNGVLLIGEKSDQTKGALHIPSRWERIILTNYGKIMVEHEFGGFQTVGRIKLARFSNENSLGLYNNAPIKSQCSAGNILGFALGSWCEGLDLDGLDIWYYVEGLSSGDPIEGYPLDQGLGATLQYELASNASDLYIGGTTPTV